MIIHRAPSTTTKYRREQSPAATRPDALRKIAIRGEMDLEHDRAGSGAVTPRREFRSLHSYMGSPLPHCNRCNPRRMPALPIVEDLDVGRNRRRTQAWTWSR